MKSTKRPGDGVLVGRHHEARSSGLVTPEKQEELPSPNYQLFTIADLPQLKVQKQDIHDGAQ